MAIYARLENGTYAEVTGVYKTDGTEITEIFQGDRLVYSATNEIYGMLPLYYSGRGFELIDYAIYGNTLQDGTPSADAPVDAQGCGVRTGNLWDNRGFSATVIGSSHYHNISNNFATTISTTEGNEVTITQRAYPTGNTKYQNGFFMIDVDFSRYAVGDVVTISFDYIVNELHAASTQFSTSVYAGKDSNVVHNTLSSGDWKISGRLTATITIIADMRPYVEVRLCGNSITVKNIMLNLGSTALPYEPYGYKLPLTVNGTEYPIYLGQVESTRRIKKLVLTGEENVTSSHLPQSLFNIDVTDYKRESGLTVLFCSHYVSLPVVNAWSEVNDMRVAFYGGTSAVNLLYIRDSRFATITDFKSYLAAQYAAGTPVTVWYVLAEPETGIVNEPLMKIGDYADTVSAAQAGVTIPTVYGANVLDMTSPVKPSEMYIKGKGIKQNRGQS